MCLILLAHRVHPAYRLVLAANRDEFYDRPTTAAAFWQEAPDVLGGRDLRAGGTWLGITRKGRMAAITNYRAHASMKEGVPSRGQLVSRFLLGKDHPETYLRRLALSADEYNGFNLILGHGPALYWYSNEGGEIRSLEPGIYGLSNHLLDTPWPKVAGGKEALRRLLAEQGGPSPEALFAILSDRYRADDADLPDTGVGLELERLLSPRFITSPDYGTRSSTILSIDAGERVRFTERTFNRNPDKATTVSFEFQMASREPVP
ncbi:MAG: NRDE family protein [Deltaproteobacteria bacterium]|nr:NRDE family protein [Deltaproteobacteria bacterium]